MVLDFFFFQVLCRILLLSSTPSLRLSLYSNNYRFQYCRYPFPAGYSQGKACKQQTSRLQQRTTPLHVQICSLKLCRGSRAVALTRT
jgi:hypothetical protein